MKLAIGIFLLLSIVSSLAGANLDDGQNSEPSAKEYVKKVFTTLRPNDFAAQVTMDYVNGKAADRSMTFWVAVRKDDARYIVFQEPKRIAGMKLLARDGNVWLFSPRRNRTHRLGRGHMGGALLDSGFRIDDIVSYTERFDRSTCQWSDKSNCKAVLITEEDGSKRTVKFDSEKNVPTAMEYLDEKGTVARKLELSDFTEVSKGRWYPKQYILTVVKSGQVTKLTFAGLRIDKGLPDKLFNPDLLEAQ